MPYIIRSMAPQHPSSDNATPQPIDVLRTTPDGEVDLEQLEYNLSLTLAQRLQQNAGWMRLVNAFKEAGRRFYEQNR